MTVKDKIKELREELNKITLKELIADLTIQEDLLEISMLVQDFTGIINPKRRAYIIKLPTDGKYQTEFNNGESNGSSP